YEAGESLVADAAKPIEGCRADYRLVDFVEAKIRRRRAEDIGYGIRDTWIDPRDGHLATALGEIRALQAREQARAENGTQESRPKANYKVKPRMETVFPISNCLAENQVKFATCTLLARALTWWNSHVRIVGNDAAYVMTWIELKKKMADKILPEK
nr:hypothetical protein [Tanacetum cinerariifolium]